MSSTDKPELNSELITRTEIPGTPFVVMGTMERDDKRVYFGTMGKYRITEPRETEKEVIDELTPITWDRIIQILLILIELQK